MHDCFISYSHKDQPTAIMIQSVLEKNGVKCWIDFRDATPGENYAGSIVRAIKNAKFFVLLLSESSSKSPHVLNEVNSAVNACVTIIPFKIDDAGITDSMEYYLGKTHWLDALTPPLEAHINKLVDLIRRYDAGQPPENFAKPTISVAQPIINGVKDKHACRMVKFQDLLSLGYTAQSISVQLVENDYINCNGIGLENEGSAEQWEGYLQDNSDTFQYLINGEDRIVGDWSIVALTDEAYGEAERGELLEESLDAEKTEMICFPGIYHGYMLSLSLLPEYRTMKNYNLLVDSLLRQMEEYSENGIYFDKWCMNVFGKEVEALIKQMGFRYKVDNVVCGKIYMCEFMPLPKLPLFKRYKRLVENYENV